MRKKLLYGFLFAAILLYVVSVFALKTNSVGLARYHLDDTQLRLLSLVFMIPTFIVWIAAVYSIDKGAHYAASIKKTKDGKGIRLLVWGLGALGLGTIINNLISRAFAHAVSQGVVEQSLSTIITTHLSVTHILVSFILFFLGSKQLLATIKKIEIPVSKYLWVTFSLIAISVPYVFAVLNNPSRMIATGASRAATYATPDWVTMSTIVAPYLLAWMFGFYAVLFLSIYQKYVGGVLYKKALSKLNRGMFGIIILTIILQFIGAFSSIILGWVLGMVMLVLILLLIFIIVAYFYIARGAQGLTKLEEVT